MHVGALPASVRDAHRALAPRRRCWPWKAACGATPSCVYQAIAHDPLTASVLSLREIRKMIAEMFRRNRSHLPQFKSVAL